LEFLVSEKLFERRVSADVGKRWWSRGVAKLGFVDALGSDCDK
jgi:hypothetical protein